MISVKKLLIFSFLLKSVVHAFMATEIRPHHSSSVAVGSNDKGLSRRGFISLTVTGVGLFSFNKEAKAAQRPPLESLLYNIVRVREATQQETRLIKSGKFKDVQRANIKLAVRFMVQNYRLADCFVAASGYLSGNDRRIQAGVVGQQAVQNLMTILEYFDSADVQNLKVGSDGLGGKEEIVLKGLEATRRNIDDFLTFFPKETVDKVQSLVKEENELNMKEFDPSLGSIVNMPPKL